MIFKKKHTFFWILFFLLVAAFFGITYIYFPHLEAFVAAAIERYGLLGVLVFALLADALEQPIGPGITGMLGLFAGLNFYSVFLFTVIGSMIGSWISYIVGREFLSHRLSGHCSKKYEKYCDFFADYGKFSLFIAAISPVPWVFFAWMAGAFKIRLRDFAFYGLIPRVARIWVILFAVNLFL